jgi:8-oxo-dGTP diphosphatase
VTETRVCAKVLLVDERDRVLLLSGIDRTKPDMSPWWFPVGGSIESGETLAEAAVREVLEETGLLCRLADEIAPARYVDAKGRRKEVRYWLMEPVRVLDWAPNHEVDRRVWLPIGEADAVLTYEHDRALLARFADAVADRGETP